MAEFGVCSTGWGKLLSNSDKGTQWQHWQIYAFPYQALPTPANQLMTPNMPIFSVVKNQYEFCVWFKWMQAHWVHPLHAVFFHNNAENCNIHFVIKIYRFRRTLSKPGRSLIHPTSTPSTLLLLKVCGIPPQHTHSTTVCIVMQWPQEHLWEKLTFLNS